MSSSEANTTARAAQPQDLESLLGELDRTARGAGERVSVQEIMDSLGERSFGPFLLLAGLLGMTPVSAIPGAPSTIALITFLVAGQLLIGRRSFWLPRFLRNRSVAADKLHRTVAVAGKPARIADRLVRPRLCRLTGPVADRLIALACVVLALCVPPLEFLPFVAFIPSAAIAAFGLGLIARDGLLVLIALSISASALAFGLTELLR
ncbi:MAG: exopolysaccharide biosynthesis protein [Phenylobacterium sp.]